VDVLIKSKVKSKVNTPKNFNRYKNEQLALSSYPTRLLQLKKARRISISDAPFSFAMHVLKNVTYGVCQLGHFSSYLLLTFLLAQGGKREFAGPVLWQG